LNFSNAVSSKKNVTQNYGNWCEKLLVLFFNPSTEFITVSSTEETLVNTALDTLKLEDLKRAATVKEKFTEKQKIHLEEIFKGNLSLLLEDPQNAK
jgi:hypothetical protein